MHLSKMDKLSTHTSEEGKAELAGIVMVDCVCVCVAPPLLVM